MRNTLKKLGEAELEIMQVIWNSGNPVTSNYILMELQEQRNWKLSTLMTSLARLADKGFISSTVPQEEICMLRLFQKMNTKLKQVNIFSKSCIIIRYRI